MFFMNVKKSNDTNHDRKENSVSTMICLSCLFAWTTLWSRWREWQGRGDNKIVELIHHKKKIASYTNAGHVIGGWQSCGTGDSALPWLLLVLLRVRVGTFKLGVVREESSVKFLKLYPESLEIQDVKLCIIQTSTFELYVERLKESPRRSSK